jgi:phospholipid/cholesterol/gamma-HCH transport system permease protein
MLVFTKGLSPVRRRGRGYHAAMPPVSTAHNTPHTPQHWGQRWRAACVGGWRALLLGAQLAVLAGTPSSYQRGAQRAAVWQQLYLATAPLLPWFLVLSALLSVVLIRIVVATAFSYGLSQYALEVLVRTLVLELIPLYAALFVAVRYAMPSAQRVRQRLAAMPNTPPNTTPHSLLRGELLPRALAGVFSVLLLAAVSCVMALVLTYLTVYGLSPWGFATYTRSVGGVFTPAVTLIFALKTLFFSLAVAVVPLTASVPHNTPSPARPRSDMTEFARLFSVVLLIEVLSLVGNYY